MAKRKHWENEVEEYRKRFMYFGKKSCKLGKKYYVKSKPLAKEGLVRIKHRAAIVKKNVAREYGTPHYQLKSVRLADFGF